MKNTIVTNNEKTREKFDSVVFVDGGFKDVLLKARELTQKGYKLVTYPLPASIRMIYSPVRTIILSECDEGIDENSIVIMENSLMQYDTTMSRHSVDERNRADYEMLDYEHVVDALEEVKRFKV